MPQTKCSWLFFHIPQLSLLQLLSSYFAFIYSSTLTSPLSPSAHLRLRFVGFDKLGGLSSNATTSAATAVRATMMMMSRGKTTQQASEFTLWTKNSQVECLMALSWAFSQPARNVDSVSDFPSSALLQAIYISVVSNGSYQDVNAIKSGEKFQFHFDSSPLCCWLTLCVMLLGDIKRRKKMIKFDIISALRIASEIHDRRNQINRRCSHGDKIWPNDFHFQKEEKPWRNSTS